MSIEDLRCKVFDEAGRVMVACALHSSNGQKLQLEQEKKLRIEFRFPEKVRESDEIVNLQLFEANSYKLSGRHLSLRFKIGATLFYLYATDVGDEKLFTIQAYRGSLEDNYRPLLYLPESHITEQDGKLIFPATFMHHRNEAGDLYWQRAFEVKKEEKDESFNFNEVGSIEGSSSLSIEVTSMPCKLCIPFSVTDWNEVYVAYAPFKHKRLKELALKFSDAPEKGYKYAWYSHDGARLYLCEMRKKLYLVDEKWFEVHKNNKNVPVRSKVKISSSTVNSNHGYRIKLDIAGKEHYIIRRGTIMTPYLATVEEKKDIKTQKPESKDECHDESQNVSDALAIYSTSNPAKNSNYQIKDAGKKKLDVVHTLSKVNRHYDLLLLASEQPSEEPQMLWLPEQPEEINIHDTMTVRCHFEDYEGAGLDKYDGLSLCTYDSTVYSDESAHHHLDGQSTVKSGGLFVYHSDVGFAWLGGGYGTDSELWRNGQRKSIRSRDAVQFAWEKPDKHDKRDDFGLVVRYGDPHRNKLKLKVKKN